MKISDYALLSDCHSSALVGLDGSIDWFCTPRFDSPSVFGRLLGAAAGYWMLAPTEVVEVERAYVDGTLVLRTVHTTPTGRVEVLDTLLLEPGSRGHEIGMKAPHVLARRINGLEGLVEMATEFVPRLEYGLTVPRFSRIDHGVETRGGPVVLRLTAEIDLFVDDDGARSTFVVAEGDSVCLQLGYGHAYGDGPVEPSEAGSVDETIESWGSWTALHQSYDGPFAPEVARSSLFLQGLTYQPSGALIAAATTSLPERMGGEWNWDYRYTWLRDASLTLRAQWVAACPDEPERFFDWIVRTGTRTDGQLYRIMYGVEGESDLTEHTLDHLEGFAGSSPVRVGNEAWTQTQMDVPGEVLDAAYLLRERIGCFDRPTASLLVSLADEAARTWQEPDAGMWESRDIPRHYVSSKVMSWVALDRAVKLAPLLQAGERVERWTAERDRVKTVVLTEGWNEDAGAYGGALGSDHLDASVLLMPLVGFVSADDPRMRATIEAIDEQLCVRGLVKRWSDEPNGFVICSFWLAECLALAGENERAEERFAQVMSHANDVGMLAEMVDLESGDQLGNTPQAFSHVGLINAAWTLGGGVMPR